MPDNVIWAGPEHGDGETLGMAFRRITGRDFEPDRCLFEDVRGMESTYVFRDVEVTVRHDGHCSISRAGEGGGGGAG
jgi:hypothetical protein